MKTFNPFKPGLLFVLLAIVAAGCAKPAADKPTLEGRWSGFEGGSTEALTLEFTGNRFAYWDSQTNEIGSGTFIVNDTVTPKQLDLTFEKIIAPEYEGKVGLAVYELSGSELKVAGAEPGTTERPTSVAGGPGIRTFTFTRQ